MLNDEVAATGAAENPETPANGADEAAPSMEDTARVAYRELMNSGAEGAEELAGEEKQAAAKSGERARGQDGKFTKADTAKVPTPQSSAGQKPPGQGPVAQVAAEGAEPQPQAKAHDAFPNTWKRELGETWKSLPEAAREEIHRRESDFHNGIRQYREAATFGQGVAQEMLPYQQIMRERGVEPRALVRDIMGTLNTLATGSDEQKASTILQLASDYGINLDAVTSPRQRAPGGVAPELAPVLQRQRQLEARLDAQEQERQQLQREEDEGRVQAFIADPKNEHAKSVAKEMAALLTSGEARDLPEAYDKAIWLNPQVRAALLAKQEQERQTRDAEQATAARKAAGANVQRRGTAPRAATPTGTMEDTARAVYRDLVSSG